MAMNNTNFGYSPPSRYPAAFSSTPSNTRSQRPRFAYSGPPSYPRPRSSASKPNPGGYWNTREPVNDLDSSSNTQLSFDSMYNNYGNSVQDPSLYSDNRPYQEVNNSYLSQNSTAYYSCNESFVDSPRTSFGQKTPGLGYTSPTTSQLPLIQQPHINPAFVSGTSLPNKQRYFQNKNETRSSAGVKHKPFFKKKNKVKRETNGKSEYHCALCSTDFTSYIPYEMHLKGSKHLKKVKTQDVLQAIQAQVEVAKNISPLGNIFCCDLCNIMLNSSLQMQTHLDGAKHKYKLQLKEKLTNEEAQAVTEAVKPATEQSKPVDQVPPPVAQVSKPVIQATHVNTKSNGGIVRSLPSDFGEFRPSKMARFSCEVCNLVVNSDIQLKQHLSSKKHQAQVEGKPLPKKKKLKPVQTEGGQGCTDAAEAAPGITVHFRKSRVPLILTVVK